jgi:hypothetical protein
MRRPCLQVPIQGFRHELLEDRFGLNKLPFSGYLLVITMASHDGIYPKVRRLILKEIELPGGILAQIDGMERFLESGIQSFRFFQPLLGII